MHICLYIYKSVCSNWDNIKIFSVSYFLFEPHDHDSVTVTRASQVPGDGLRGAAGDGPAGEHGDHLVGAVAPQHAHRQERLHHDARHLRPHPLPLHHAHHSLGGKRERIKLILMESYILHRDYNDLIATGQWAPNYCETEAILTTWSSFVEFWHFQARRRAQQSSWSTYVLRGNEERSMCVGTISIQILFPFRGKGKIVPLSRLCHDVTENASPRDTSVSGG